MEQLVAVGTWLAGSMRDAGTWLDGTGVGPVVGFLASLAALVASVRASRAATMARQAAQRAADRLGHNETLASLAAVCQILEEVDLQILARGYEAPERARIMFARTKLSELQGLFDMADDDRATLVAAKTFLSNALRSGVDRDIVSDGLAEQSDQLRLLLTRLRRAMNVR